MHYDVITRAPYHCESKLLSFITIIGYCYQVASDAVHKKASATKYAEDEEILRVPLALAMVKLLQHLPKGSLNRTLPK